MIGSLPIWQPSLQYNDPLGDILGSNYNTHCPPSGESAPFMPVVENMQEALEVALSESGGRGMTLSLRVSAARFPLLLALFPRLSVCLSLHMTQILLHFICVLRYFPFGF